MLIQGVKVLCADQNITSDFANGTNNVRVDSLAGDLQVTMVTRRFPAQSHQRLHPKCPLLLFDFNQNLECTD
jgi:hypothetical protein